MRRASPVASIHFKGGEGEKTSGTPTVRVAKQYCDHSRPFTTVALLCHSGVAVLGHFGVALLGHSGVALLGHSGQSPTSARWRQTPMTKFAQYLAYNRKIALLGKAPLSSWSLTKQS